MTSDPTLTYIKEKVDEMAKAIVQLARMEERMLTLFKRMDKHDDAISELGKRISKMESSVGINGQTLRFAERIFWIVATAGVGYLFFLLRGS
jgi:CII-binding regulator of phage lambda lysogenization HflD